jgi:hypothetical protein
MAIPTDAQSLIEYSLRKLGKGAIDINVTDEQAQDRVEEALDYFQQFHFDGVEKKYLAVQVTQDMQNTRSITMPANTFNVTRIWPLNGDSVSNNSISGDFNIFDLNYQLRLNEMYDFTSADYVYFELANQHLRTLEILFIGEIPIRYNRYTNILYIDMDWDNRVGIGTFVIVECFTILDPTGTLFWNDIWLKQMVTALIKQQWGENMKKYSGTPLPGGITVNGQQIYDEATAELDKLKELIRDTYEQPAEWYVA